ncbi:MAG TPA: hypothetical protein VMX35_03020 [Acidobacteriota bacterium]|nr:hypothetical protein [Acidobacteriota bacterium]
MSGKEAKKPRFNYESNAVGVRVTDGPADPRRILDLLRPKRADG